MTVYVDSFKMKYRGMVMSHMVADTIAELHAMADKIGIQRKWFQVNASFPHYDIAQTKRYRAILEGAQEISKWKLVEFMKKKRADPVFIEEWADERRKFQTSGTGLGQSNPGGQVLDNDGKA